MSDRPGGLTFNPVYVLARRARPRKEISREKVFFPGRFRRPGRTV